MNDKERAVVEAAQVFVAAHGDAEWRSVPFDGLVAAVREWRRTTYYATPNYPVYGGQRTPHAVALVGGDKICECYTEFAASRIAAALNAEEERKP